MLTDLNEVIGHKLLDKHENLYINTVTGVRKILEVDEKTFKITCSYSNTSKRRIFKCNNETPVFNSILRAKRCMDKVK